MAKLYWALADYSYNDDKNFFSLKYLKKAKKYKDTVDNSILAANIYLTSDKKEKALKEITENLNKDVAVWKLNQKATLLLKLDAPNKALEVYKRVEKKDTTYTNNSNLAKAFENLKQYSFAREYLVKDTVNEWKKTETIAKLANFDLKYTKAKIALETYNKSQENNFYDDFWGIKRLKIFFKDASLSWSFNDFLHLLILLATLVFIFIIPYILILPIHFLGARFNLKPQEIKIPFDWNLKHFWLIIFTYFLIDFVLQLFFDYQVFIDSWFADYYAEEGGDLVNAKHNVFYFLTMFLGIMLFLNRYRVLYIIKSNIPVLKTISMFVVFMILNLSLVKVLRSTSLIAVPLSIGEEIKEIIRQYGFWLTFLFIVILVPIYEEIIFRGIILSSVEKHIGFWKANLIQAILFALVHQNVTLFLFYLLFAITIGLLVKKSKGLLTGILFHAGNNFIFLISINHLMKTETLLQIF